jgi:hypothetical protein
MGSLSGPVELGAMVSLPRRPHGGTMASCPCQRDDTHNQSAAPRSTLDQWGHRRNSLPRFPKTLRLGRLATIDNLSRALTKGRRYGLPEGDSAPASGAIGLRAVFGVLTGRNIQADGPTASCDSLRCWGRQPSVDLPLGGMTSGAGGGTGSGAGAGSGSGAVSGPLETPLGPSHPADDGENTGLFGTGWNRGKGLSLTGAGVGPPTSRDPENRSRNRQRGQRHRAATACKTGLLAPVPQVPHSPSDASTPEPSQEAGQHLTGLEHRWTWPHLAQPWGMSAGTPQHERGPRPAQAQHPRIGIRTDNPARRRHGADNAPRGMTRPPRSQSPTHPASGTGPETGSRRDSHLG